MSKQDVKEVVAKEVEVKEEEVKVKKEANRHQECDVVFVSGDYCYFKFQKDHVLRLRYDFKEVPKSVVVEFIGDYGKANFKLIKIVR